MIGQPTERTRFLRRGKLEPDEAKLLDDVEKYGCHIIQVREDGGFPGWSYTIGLGDLLGCPELIVLGLKENVALSLLNECAGRLQRGLRLEPRGRAQGLLTNVECEFRTVQKRWLKPTMGYALWFYGGEDFSALQCVYPDQGNRFPWDDDFDSKWRSRQPLLFPHSLSSRVEEDFWAANDPNSSLKNWKFNEPPHTGVFTTKRVINGDEPVMRVFHDIEDGAWQFHGAGESESEDITYACFHHIVDRDSTIQDLADLPTGWCAWRENVSTPWIRELSAADTEES